MSSKKRGKTVTIQLRPPDGAGPSDDQRRGSERPRTSTSHRPPVQPVVTKSRYKIYEIPRKSEFSEYLERIRRDQETRREEARTSVRLSQDVDQGSSRVGESSQKVLQFDRALNDRVLAGGSIVEYRPKRRHPFKELVSEYLRRSTLPKQTIRVYKIPIIQSWEEAIEYSLRRVRENRPDGAPRWKQTRLQWLEELEEANRKLPEPVRRNESEEAIDASICCFPMLGRRRLRQGS
uniref:Uncharacterized protein n=1 Tax=Anopheles atroparvus TaxID=41427 RepID=A0A182J5G7_ANOAO